jgi:hypothetical protein
MQRLRQVMQQMIAISGDELDSFVGMGVTKTFSRQEVLSRPWVVPRYYCCSFKQVEKREFSKSLNICYPLNLQVMLALPKRY